MAKNKIIDRDRGWNALKKNLKALDGRTLVIGFPEGTSQDVLTKASANEFGTRTIPERAFLRPTFDRFEKEWYKVAAKDLGKNILSKRFSPNDSLEKIGRTAQDSIQRAIRAKSSPANATSTVSKKGFDDPLIETHEMHDSVTYKIED